jgi:DNA-binding XRE family transcriptional regulator
MARFLQQAESRHTPVKRSDLWLFAHARIAKPGLHWPVSSNPHLTTHSWAEGRSSKFVPRKVLKNQRGFRYRKARLIDSLTKPWYIVFYAWDIGLEKLVRKRLGKKDQTDIFTEKMQELPEILRKIRLDKKLSQENIAEELGIDTTTYGRYEKRESQIKFEQVVQLAKFYKLTLDELYNYGNPNYKVQGPHASNPSKSFVPITVNLDGTSETLDVWVKRLTAINKVL